MNDKKQKKPMPEYWYDGKPIQDEEALVKALIKDGKIEVKKNITLYELHEDVCEMNECAFTWDLDFALDLIKVTVDELDEGEDLNGIESIDYVYGESLTINERKYKWSGALRRLVKLGVIKVSAHKTVYCAEGDDYWYLETDRPLEFLKYLGAFMDFEEYIEQLFPDSEEMKMLEEVYDI